MTFILPRWKIATGAAFLLVTLAAWFFLPSLPGLASSHREAPLISQDPSVDQTDLYAFMSPTDPSKVVFIGNYYPMQEPEAGPNYYRFADHALYAFHIDTNGDAKEDVTYAFAFSTKVDNVATFLYNTKPVTKLSDLNVHQFWSAYRIDGVFRGNEAQLSSKNVVATGEMAPPVIGSKSVANYASLGAQAVVEKGSQGKFFAGPRDDSFFVDLKVFDLLNLGSGRDTLAGKNVNSIVLEVPVKNVVKDDSVVGVWGATYRPAVTVLRGNGQLSVTKKWIQVSRLGMPLVNEVVVPLRYKDYFNASHPSKDADTKPYADVVLKPELAGLLKAVLGLNVPTENRKDLVTLFLTGVPNLNQPKNVRAAEMLRLNTSIPPSKAPHRLGVFGGDNAGFPNGRRLADDVTDIAIQAVAGKLVEGYKVDEKLGDGVDANDMPFSAMFPYLAMPHLRK